MTIAYRLDGALLPYETVRFNPEAEAAFPSAAWYGEPVVAGVIIEDSSGVLDIDGWHTFTVEETACSKPRIFTGWIAGKEISRGRDSNRVGAARVWNCDIVDQNALFSFEVFRSSAASLRPAETDVARVQAIIASHAMGGTPIADNGRLSTDDPRNLDASNFVTQYPAQALFSTAGQCAKNFYAYWDESANEISIHYDAVGDGPAATISFSNVSTDINGTTVFGPSRDAALSQDPYNLYTGVLLGYAGGYTYQRNDDLIDVLSPSEFSPVNFLRDQFESSTRIGRAATATSYTASQLARFGVEKVTLNFSAILPAAVVNLAHAGDIVTVKFSHLPGYTSNTDVTIIRRSVRPVDGHDSLYEVTFECADFEGAEAGGGGIGGLPVQSSCDVAGATLVQEKYGLGSVGGPPYTVTATWDDDPTPGNMLVASYVWDGVNTVDTGAQIPGWTRQEDGAMAGVGGEAGMVIVFTKIAEAGDTTSVVMDGVANGAAQVFVGLQEWNGVDTVNAVAVNIEDASTGSGAAFVAIPPDPTSEPAVLVGTSIVCCRSGAPSLVFSTVQDFEGAPFTVGGGVFVGHKIVSGPGGVGWATLAQDYPSGQKWVYIGLALTCSGSDFPPLPGQPVNNETPGGDVDGANTDFTTAHPHAAGSLRVLCNGIDVTAQVASSDPVAGTFTLDFAPWPTDVLTTFYQGHP